MIIGENIFNKKNRSQSQCQSSKLKGFNKKQNCTNSKDFFSGGQTTAIKLIDAWTRALSQGFKVFVYNSLGQIGSYKLSDHMGYNFRPVPNTDQDWSGIDTPGLLLETNFFLVGIWHWYENIHHMVWKLSFLRPVKLENK